MPYPTTSASTVAERARALPCALEGEERGALAEAGPLERDARGSRTDRAEPVEREEERLAHRLGAADEERVGAPLLEEHVGAGDRVERAAVAVAHAHVERAQVFPDARVAGGAVGDREREARRVDVARVFEHGDAIELGDGLERAVGVRDHDADALGPRARLPLERGPGAVDLETRVVEGQARRDDQQLGQPIERPQPLVAEVLGGVEAAHLGHLRAGVGRGVEGLDEPVGPQRLRALANGRQERLAPDAERRSDAEAGDGARLHVRSSTGGMGGSRPGFANTVTALYPPKASELLTTTSLLPRRATFATTSTSHSGSGVS